MDILTYIGFCKSEMNTSKGTQYDEKLCPICQSKGKQCGKTLASNKFGSYELFGCTKCGHKWILKPEEILSDVTREMVSRQPSTSADWLLSRLPEHLKQSQYLRVLDIGCWDGAVMAGLPSSWVRHGVEINQRAVQSAEKRGIKVFSQSLETASIELRSYDLILMMDILEHLKNPISALQKASEILVPGGYLFALTGNSASVSSRLFKGSWYYYNYPEHVTFFCPFSINIALDKVRINTIQITKQSHQTTSPLRTIYKVGHRLFNRHTLGCDSLPKPLLWRDTARLVVSRILRFNDHLTIIGKRRKD